MGERTGSRVFQWVWSYVLGDAERNDYEGQGDSPASVLSWEPKPAHHRSSP
ncbi:hypothetical protein CCHR01_10495 [Colletotrichum chrysophilum]|uniref:Uncharacterized protein n=1 Tax=Colletotrichum chrysophilum TaxID=1836956 RepID=A0AAD9AET7_9PEZI|nr:hypothetical protein CCHR01_10495 [Colletotrichum chrysophilum]